MVFTRDRDVYRFHSFRTQIYFPLSTTFLYNQFPSIGAVAIYP